MLSVLIGLETTSFCEMHRNEYHGQKVFFNVTAYVKVKHKTNRALSLCIYVYLIFGCIRAVHCSRVDDECSFWVNILSDRAKSTLYNREQNIRPT